MVDMADELPLDVRSCRGRPQPQHPPRLGTRRREVEDEGSQTGSSETVQIGIDDDIHRERPSVIVEDHLHPSSMDRRDDVMVDGGSPNMATSKRSDQERPVATSRDALP